MKQGKMKVQRHRKIVEKSKPPPRDDIEEEEPSNELGDDFLDMIDKDDVEFLQAAAAGQSYSMFKNDNVDRLVI